ncbi:MAG: amino acid adenylation domain-containing protein, partial [Desulfobacterales bacterium]|nr:amino acid adenylation domain-containing protein [Desulfobacterales bacterium]
GDTVLQSASASFDVSLEQLLTPLCHGARVVQPSASLLTPAGIAGVLEQETITVADIPPALWQTILAEDPFPDLKHLGLLLLGGERLPAPLAAETMNRLPRTTKVFNAYGPTEATITTTLYALPGTFTGKGPVPIGRPLDNTRVFILDRQHTPCPIGVPGELCIAGERLARGYLGREDLTREKFPELTIFGKRRRIYKTGDLARWLPDADGREGVIEFMGRTDDQVKLRGFRIEPGEIEAVLRRHDAVRDAAVILKAGDNPTIVAFATLNTGIDDAAGALGTWLKEHLPAYMRPARIVILDRMPLTPGGKIDRNALPVHEAGRFQPLDDQSQEYHQPPRTETERLLCTLWSQVLDVDITSRTADFFESGGHSLTAARLVSRIRECFSVELPIPKLFELTTPAAQAGWIEGAGKLSASPHLIPLKDVEARNVKAPAVLSFAQQRLWFLTQVESGTSLYNMPALLSLEGPLDHTALVKAIDNLTRRHPSLRTCFPTVDGKAAVHPAPSPQLFETDLSAHPREALQTKTGELIHKDFHHSFNPAAGPLVLIHLIRWNHRRHFLFFNLHHIIGDGWSMNILIREMKDLYAAYSQGRTPDLPLPPITYTAYAAWQRKWLSRGILDQQLAYWKEKLSGVPGLLELPADFRRPAEQSYRGRNVQTRMTPEITTRLKKVARQEGVTLFMSLMTAFQALLHRYTDQEDILVGSPVANRTHPQTEPLVGLFVNTLVFHTRIRGTSTFKELLGQVRQTALEAFAHQDLPFEVLVDHIRPERHLSYSPVFQVMFVMENTPPEYDNPPGLKISSAEHQFGNALSGVSKFDLTLTVRETEDYLCCHWEYAADLFRPERMARMAEHFQIFLEGLLEIPDQPIAGISFLTGEEQRLLMNWSAPADTGLNLLDQNVPDPTLMDLFESQVAQTPDRTAVVFCSDPDDENPPRLTYRELNTRANHLARHLVDLGVRQDTLVGICAERSQDLIVGLFGILKAGGAYVPLDPSYPEERLAFILDDSQVQVLLTQRQLSEKFAGFRHHTVCLDKTPNPTRQPLSPVTEENLPRRNRPEHAAYVLYTSGSTGIPKGVVIEHRNCCALLHWAKETFDPEVLSGVLASTSVNFDLSVYELFFPLCNGGRVFLVENAMHLPLLAQRHEIKLINTVPSAISGLLEVKGIPDSVKVINLAGEPLRKELAAALYRHTAVASIYNLYGPSEDTTYSTVSLVPDDPDIPIDIGRPISNTRVYLLDADHKPVPVGTPGELCLAGAGLAREYLNRPELTAEKFIEVDLFGETRRIYKTGDRARWLAGDGNVPGRLEFLGRMDNQVKLRGFRIELGEIEAVLNRSKWVEEAVVILHEASETTRLVAFIILNTRDEGSISALQSWMKTQVPAYMIPGTVVRLEEMPLNPNGKIDRGVLRKKADAIVSTAATGPASPEAPRTETEQQLLDAWKTVLNQADIGVHDNFFERGGDSILSIRIISLAREAGVILDPRDLFRHQTIAELARAARTQGRDKQNTHRDKHHNRQKETGTAPLVPIQEAFFHWDLPNRSHFNQSVLLKLPSGIDPVALGHALKAVTAHHDVLSLRFQKAPTGWTQAYHGHGDDLPFHVEDLEGQTLDDQLRSMKAQADAWQASLDIEKGPLHRLVLFRLGDQCRLLWCIHHLVVDGVSWRILLEDLHRAYTHPAESCHPDAHNTTSFKAWAERLHKWKDEECFARDAAYWRRLPESPLLPVDHPEGRNRLAGTLDHTTTFSREETNQLLTQAPSAYRTRINDLLLTTLMLTLEDWTGQARHLIDLESHGRSTRFDGMDLSRTVGWFTSLYSVSLALPAKASASHDSDDHRFGRSVKAVKEQLRAVPNEGIGYGVLRHICREPLPRGQILFNYLGQFDQSLPAGHWQFAREDSGQTVDISGGHREYRLEINSMVKQGRLTLTWSYSRDLYTTKTIRSLADRFQRQLSLLLNHCTRHFGYTPSDFPLARYHADPNLLNQDLLSQNRIDRLTRTYKNNIETLYPLSPMQQGMLFHTLHEEDPNVYTTQLHCRIRGPLDPGVFRRSWETLLARHPALRTVFIHDEGQPLQVVLKETNLPWHDLDWTGIPEAEHARKLEELLTHERQQAFDPGQAPLMRIRLIREARDQYQFVLHQHHLLADGWSIAQLFTELLDLYHTDAALPAVRPYQDYIDWLYQQDLRLAKAYWQENLKDFYTPTPLPRAGHATTAPAYQEFSMNLNGEGGDDRDHNLSDKLAAFCRRHHLTRNSLFQGAWALLLSRYGLTDEVVFGVTTSGRQIPLDGADRMVGLFINTLPLRVKTTHGGDLVSFLTSIQRRQQDNHRYAYASLTDIRNWSSLPKGVDLFNTLMVFENFPVGRHLSPDNDHEGSYPSSICITDFQGIETTNYPLTLVVVPGSPVLLRMIYDSRRFTRQDITGMLGHLRQLLKGMIASPQRDISRIPMLTEAEEQQLIRWGNLESDRPGITRSIVDIFEDQAEKTPDRAAVIPEKINRDKVGHDPLTYRELNEKANRLAHALIRLGVRKGSLVGLCVHRSPAMIIGMLGILKAGGAYLPLDPEYPEKRLRYMIEDSRIDILLTRRNMTGRFSQAGPALVCMDGEADYPVDITSNPGITCPPDTPAYVMYTSGSTGRPKGVRIPHRGVVRLVRDTGYFSRDHGQTFLQNAPFSFDAATFEIWGALLNGARLVLMPPGKPELSTLADILEKQQITTLWLTSSLFNRMIEDRPESLRGLSQLLVGGEELSPFHVRRAMDMLPSTRIMNGYGPTENTTFSTAYLIRDSFTRSVPIGFPITNSTAY